MLHSIRELREQAGQPSAELLVGPYHTLALLHCLLRETAKVRETLLHAGTGEHFVI